MKILLSLLLLLLLSTPVYADQYEFQGMGNGSGIFLPLDGGTMAGSINMDNYNITGIGTLVFPGASSGSVTVGVPAAAGTGTIFNYPHTNGTSGYVLSTDGSGNTSWIAGAAGVYLPLAGGTMSGNITMAGHALLTVSNTQHSVQQTAVPGSTSGTIYWSMPEQGSAYKKVVIVFNGVTDAGETLTFPTAFTYTPDLIANPTTFTAMTGYTLTTAHIVLPATTAFTGTIVIEGI